MEQVPKGIDVPAGTDDVRVEQLDAAIWRITVDRPAKRNALSIAVRDAMSDVLDALAPRPDLKVVIVTGAPPVFSAGFDLDEFAAAEADPALADRLWTSSNRWHAALRNFPLPLIAQVNGPALAGGFDLATMCDLRICSASATFGRPEVTFAAPIYSIVRDLLGGAVARELAFTDRRLDATEAHRLGLVSAVVPDADLAEAAVAWAHQVAIAPADGLRHSKALAVAGAKYATDADLAW